MHHDTPRPPARYANKPRLYRLACELSTYENPYRVLNALKAILSTGAKEGGGNMSNNERFNQLLNSCQNPRAVYSALQAFAVQDIQPERCADTPNFLRLAQELNKFKHPDKAADMLLALAEPLLKEGGNGQ